MTQVTSRVPHAVARMLGCLTHALTGLAAVLAGAVGHLTDTLTRGASTLTRTLHHLPSPVSYTA
jgi:hypothetical protein